MDIISMASGVLSAIGILVLYTGTLVAFNGWSGAVEQFEALWYLFIPLAAAFGVQVGLYMNIKHSLRSRGATPLAAGGASAGVGMLACCVHHATDALPLLGMSALGIFLIRFQKPLLMVSIAINIAGIWYMHKRLRKATL